MIDYINSQYKECLQLNKKFLKEISNKKELETRLILNSIKAETYEDLLIKFGVIKVDYKTVKIDVNKLLENTRSYYEKNND